MVLFFVTENSWRIQQWFNPPETLQFTETVTLFGTKSCGYCAAARRFFNNKKIRFQDLDVEESASAHQQFKSLGGRGVPLIVIGDEVLYGYSPQAIRAALAKLGTEQMH